MPTEINEEILEKSYSEQKSRQKRFESVLRDAYYFQLNKQQGVFRVSENDDEKFIIIMDEFFKFVSKKTNIDKEDLNSYTLRIVNYNDEIKSNENYGVSIDDANKKIIVDPKVYKNLIKIQLEKKRDYVIVGNHFASIASGKKKTTTRTHAQDILVKLSNKKALEPLQRLEPEKYAEFSSQVISAVEVKNRSYVIQRTFLSLLDEAITLCELMLLNKCDEIGQNASFKKVISMKKGQHSISENNWQNFILSYKEIIFFDHVELLSELKAFSDDGTSKFDFFMIDQYNYPVIIELKRADKKVLMDDTSHTKERLSGDASIAVSQLIYYMNKFKDNYEEVKNEIEKRSGGNMVLNGNKTVYGILIIGGGTVDKDGNEIGQLPNFEIWRQNDYLKNIKIITYRDILDSLIAKRSSFNSTSVSSNTQSDITEKSQDDIAEESQEDITK